MIGNALDDSRLADSAIAALAVMHRVFAGFKQHVEATDGLHTGAYGKTLTFSLSTTTP